MKKYGFRNFGKLLSLSLVGSAIALFSLAPTSSASPASDPFTTPLYDVSLTHDGSQPCGLIDYSSPVLADLDKNGQKEIIIGSVQNSSADFGYAPCLAVINANGTVRWTRVVPGSINSTAAVGDLNGDGRPDIVVGIGAQDEPPTPGGMVAYDSNGTQLWYYRTLDRIGGGSGHGQPNGMPDGVWGSPSIVDLLGDGRKQVVFGAWDSRIHVLNGNNGTPFAAPAGNPWPAEMLDTIWSSPAIADLNGDGKPDIVFGGDISANGGACTGDGGLLRAMYNQPGVGPTFTPGFGPTYGCLAGGGALTDVGHHGKYVNQSLYSSPAIGDFAGRGKLIFIGSGCAFPAGTNCNGSGNGKAVTVFDQAGNQIASLATDAPVFGSPALVDINGDGVLDIVVASMGLGWLDGTGKGGTLYAWSGAPGFPLLWSVKPKNWNGKASIRIPSSPIVADLNGDGNPEILFGYAAEIVVFSNSGVQLTETGAQIVPNIPTFWMGRSTVNNSPAVGDLDGSGTLEIVGAGSYCDPAGTCQKQGRVRIWSASTLQLLNPQAMGQAPQSKLGWPMFRGEPTHQAYIGATQVASLAPLTPSLVNMLMDAQNTQPLPATITVQNTSGLVVNYTMSYSPNVSGPAGGQIVGNATDALGLSVNPLGLGVGMHHLSATLLAAGVQNGEQTIVIDVAVANLNRLFLPMIRR